MTVFPPPVLVHAPVMLVIGDIGRWEANGRELPSLDRCTFVSFDEMTEDLILSLQPDYIVSSLMGHDHDALDVAAKLQEIGYRGAYRSIVDRLPNAEAVRREVQSVAPDVDFEILELRALN